MKYKLTYSDNLPEGIGGKCYYPWYPKFGTCNIVILPKYRDDIGIRNHEILHAKQYATKFFHSILYKFSKGYRYKCELEAYTEQIKAYGYTTISQCSWIITALVDKYNLDISRLEINTDIRKILKTVL